jgi:hypothetical protein
MQMNKQTQKRILKMAGVALALATATPTIAPLQNAQAQTYSQNQNMAQTARIRLNGQPLATSVAPVVRNGTTLVPMRDIFEALGATVVWDARTQEINAQKDNKRIWLQIGNRTARVDRNQQWLSYAPVLEHGSTLVPLRFVSEALGAQVNWNGERRVVRITTEDRQANSNGNNDGEQVAGTITIPAGVVVPVTMDRDLSSATARVGDSFTATVKSDREGDSEFPAGTKLQGRVTEVRAKAVEAPGILGLEFRRAILPDNSSVAIYGDLIALDKDSVDTSNGRITAKKGEGGTDVKVIGIGAAAGYVLGKVLGKNELVTAILGAAGGYLYDKNRDKGKEQEAVVKAGATLGVRLSQPVTYTDTGNYWNERKTYLR